VIDRSEVLATAEGRSFTPANLDRLTKQFGTELAAWGLQQMDLRHRARAKFALAEQMIFVKEGLEQSTSEAVAKFHADRFPEGEMVFDLTAGIGADTIALARRGPVTAYEMDETRADCARWNLAVHGQDTESTTKIITGDCFDQAPWGNFVFADPARRSGGLRLTAGDEFSPNPAEIVERATEVELGILKLSPMQRDEELSVYGPRVEFVSHRREGKEALVSFGPAAGEGFWATRAETGESVPRDEGYLPSVSVPEEFIYDADPALVRAHAIRSVATSLRQIGDTAGYLTGPLIESPWLRRYSVIDFVRPDQKSVQAVLRRVGGFVEEVKQRGAGVNAEKLRTTFRAEGDRKVSLIVITEGKGRRYALCEIA
jgi:hypothetical protein